MLKYLEKIPSFDLYILFVMSENIWEAVDYLVFKEVLFI